MPRDVQGAEEKKEAAAITMSLQGNQNTKHF
jgi:hypothetical protein